MLYVSTDILTIDHEDTTTEHTSQQAQPLPLDITVNNKLYRQLSPQYYAYLNHRTGEVKKMYGRNQIKKEKWDVWRNRFNALQETAVKLFGEDVLIQAVDNFDVNEYVPPSVQAQKTANMDVPSDMPSTVTIDDSEQFFDAFNDPFRDDWIVTCDTCGTSHIIPGCDEMDVEDGYNLWRIFREVHKKCGVVVIREVDAVEHAIEQATKDTVLTISDTPSAEMIDAVAKLPKTKIATLSMGF